jgi:hypothetical protein
MPAPMTACVKCYRVWPTKRMNFSIVDLENMKNHNKIFVLCEECNGKEKSILYDGENFILE